jgi:hypothetical protein
VGGRGVVVILSTVSFITLCSTTVHVSITKKNLVFLFFFFLHQ